jgi:hypothetical protein
LNAIDIGIAPDTLSGNKWETPPTEGSINFLGLSYTGGGIGSSVENAESEQISADLMRSAPVVTGVPINMAVDYEFMFNPQSQIFLPMIFSSTGDNTGWTNEINHVLAANSASTSTAGAGGANNLNYFKLTTNDITVNAANAVAKLLPGQWIYTSGFADAANNGFHKVWGVDINTSQPGFDLIYVHKTLVNSTTLQNGADVRFVSSYIRNGSVRRTMTAIQEYPALDTPFYLKAYGWRANSFTLNVEQGGKLTASSEFLGTRYEYSKTTSWKTSGSPGNTYTPPPVTPLMNSSSANTRVFGSPDQLAAHSPHSTAYSCIRTATIEISDRAREQRCIGSLQAGNTGVNSFYPSLSLTRYFSNPYSFLKIYDQATNSYYPEWVDLQIEDNNGNSFIFTVPYWTPVSGDLPSGSLDADLEITLQGNGARYTHPNDDETGTAGGTNSALGVAWAMQVCKFNLSATPTTT